MIMCSICNKNPVTLRGCKTCSLTCATLACGDNPIDVNVRLRDEVSKAKSRGISPRMNRADTLQKEWQKANPGCFK